jgi:hypothetical protein
VLVVLVVLVVVLLMLMVAVVDRQVLELELRRQVAAAQSPCWWRCWNGIRGR